MPIKPNCSDENHQISMQMGSKLSKKVLVRVLDFAIKSVPMDSLPLGWILVLGNTC